MKFVRFVMFSSERELLLYKKQKNKKQKTKQNKKQKNKKQKQKQKQIKTVNNFTVKSMHQRIYHQQIKKWVKSSFFQNLKFAKRKFLQPSPWECISCIRHMAYAFSLLVCGSNIKSCDPYVVKVTMHIYYIYNYCYSAALKFKPQHDV